jgi:hypothetical protein
MKIDFSKANVLYLSDEQHDIESDSFKSEGKIDYIKIRKKVEPWLAALFQSEHLSLLVGSGLSIALGGNKDLMKRLEFGESFKTIINNKAEEEARTLGRGSANFEDDIRVAIKLLEGYKILKENDKSNSLEKELNEMISNFVKVIIKNESSLLENDKQEKRQFLKSFLLSFGSRTATRDRLHIFTTNYDRFIEYGLDEAGLLMIDRFIGKLQPIMRFHKIDLDYHYNPPGIRGEPRYVEGVVRYTKLHGSIDWKFFGDRIIKVPLSFGCVAEEINKYIASPLESVVLFPNSSKAYETSFFPYSELFRDFSGAICRPNSVLVTYGYGFGDSHINRIILDMLTIPSTHLVIISYDNASDRINNFIEKCNPSQLTLMIGSELGDFEKLVTYYLPKPAIDRITERERRILEKRGVKVEESSEGENKQEGSA